MVSLPEKVNDTLEERPATSRVLIGEHVLYVPVSGEEGFELAKTEWDHDLHEVDVIDPMAVEQMIFGRPFTTVSFPWRNDSMSLVEHYSSKTPNEVSWVEHAVASDLSAGLSRALPPSDHLALYSYKSDDNAESIHSSSVYVAEEIGKIAMSTLGITVVISDYDSLPLYTVGRFNNVVLPYVTHPLYFKPPEIGTDLGGGVRILTPKDRADFAEDLQRRHDLWISNNHRAGIALAHIPLEYANGEGGDLVIDTEKVGNNIAQAIKQVTVGGF